MSNTTLTPTVAAAALAGVAGAMGLGVAPVGGAAALPGVAPTATSVTPVIPRGGLPVSWSALGQGAAGSSIGPISWSQVRLKAPTGTYGSGGNLLVQGSPDGSTWTTLAATNGSVIADVTQVTTNRALAAGVVANALPDGSLVVALADPGLSAAYRYLRVAVAGGDGSTSLSVAGNVGQGAL